MRFLIPLLILLSLCHRVTATNYYFASSGNDNATINSSQYPYRSLYKIATLPLKAGDYILLKSNDRFNGSIIPTGSGSLTNITITTYGGIAPAIVNGTTTIGHWTPIGKNIYVSEVLHPQSTVHNVIVDNRQVEQGRYPNDYPGTGGFLIFQNFFNTSKTCTLYASQLAAYGIDSTYIGADIKIKPYLSDIDGGKITSIKNNSLSFENGNMFYQVGRSNCGWFITNSLKTLDLPGEWYYSNTENRLYMYFADNPNNHTTEVSTTDVLFQPKYSFYTLRNVILRGANKYGISSSTAGRQHLTVDNCQLLLTGISAVAMANFNWLSIQNTIINGANDNGIVTGFNCDSTYIVNNNISNIGLLLSNLYCDSAFQKRMAYAVFSGYAPTKGLYAYNNNISNVGYIGIFFTGSFNIVSHNYITNTCLKLDDGGGIYFGGWKTYQSNHNLIENNIIFHTPGCILGFPASHVIPNAILLDDNAGQVVIRNNYVNGSGQSCLYIHNANNATVYNNIFTSATLALVMMQDDNIGGRLYNTILTNNELLITDTTQLIYCFYASGDTSDNALTQYGKIDYNYFLSPNILTGIMSHVDTFSRRGVADYTLSDWRMNMPYDWHSQAIATSQNKVQVFYALTDSTIHLTGTWYRSDGSALKDSVRLKDHTAILLTQRYSNNNLITKY